MFRSRSLAAAIVLLVGLSFIPYDVDARGRGRRVRIDTKDGAWVNTSPVNVDKDGSSRVDAGPPGPAGREGFYLPMTLRIGSTVYTHLYVYENGFVSLGNEQADGLVSPSIGATALDDIPGAVMAPLYADLDCTLEAPPDCRVQYGILTEPLETDPPYTNAVRISWGEVLDADEPGISSVLDAGNGRIQFQLRLINRSDPGDGDFDLEFNYLEDKPEDQVNALPWTNTPLIAGVKADGVLLDFARLGSTLPVDDANSDSGDCAGGQIDPGGFEFAAFDPAIPLACNFVLVEFRDGVPNLKTFTADVGVEATAGTDSLNATEIVDFTVAVTNDGSDAATNVTVTVDRPADTAFLSATPDTADCAEQGALLECSLDDIAAAASESLVISLQPNDAGLQTYAVSVDADQFDPVNGNDEGQVAITVDPSADVSVSSCSGPATLQESSTYSLSCIVENAGPQEANGVELSVSLPSVLTFVSSSDCTASGGVLTCDAGALASGASVTLAAQLRASSAGSGTVSGEVSATENDQDLSNNGPVTRPVTVESAATTDGGGGGGGGGGGSPAPVVWLLVAGALARRAVPGRESEKHDES